MIFVSSRKFNPILDFYLQNKVLCTDLLPVLFFFLFFKRNLDKKNVQVIVLLVTISFFVDLGLYFLGKKGIHNAWLINLYVLFETCLLMIFFSRVIEKKFKNTFLKVILIAFSTIWLFQNYKTNFSIIEPISFVIEVLFVIALSGLFFYQQTNNPKKLFIYESASFWIVIAYFICLTGTLFLFLYWSKLSEKEQLKYMYLNDLFSIIRTVLLSIAMIIKEKKQEPPPVNNYPMQYTL